MTYPLTALQDALQTALGNNAEIQSLLGSPIRLYDHAPPNVAYPYVIYGDQRATPFDTKDTTGLEAIFTFTVFSRARGRAELRKIESALYTALHRQNFSFSQAAFCQCLFTRAEQKLDSDGLTYRARLEFRLTLTHQGL